MFYLTTHSTRFIYSYTVKKYLSMLEWNELQFVMEITKSKKRNFD